MTTNNIPIIKLHACNGSVGRTEELLERKSSCSGLENRNYGCRGYAELTTRHPFEQKLTLTSPTRGGHQVRIVRSRTWATGFVVFFYWNVFEENEVNYVQMMEQLTNYMELNTNREATRC
jgi:hypothetical protein